MLKGHKAPTKHIRRKTKLDLANINARDLAEVRGSARDASRKKPHGKIDHAKALNLRLKGVSVKDLSLMFHVTPEGINKVLRKYIKSTRELKAYKENRADIIADLSHRVLETIRPDEGPVQSNLQKATTFGILFDKEQKERDKDKMKLSTVSIHTEISNNIKKIDAEMTILEGPLVQNSEPEQGLRGCDLTDEDITLLEAEILEDENDLAEASKVKGGKKQ